VSTFNENKDSVTVGGLFEVRHLTEKTEEKDDKPHYNRCPGGDSYLESTDCNSTPTCSLAFMIIISVCFILILSHRERFGFVLGTA
jgi:hypothetical protein